jgi:hypothetical protein
MRGSKYAEPLRSEMLKSEWWILEDIELKKLADLVYMPTEFLNKIKELKS